MIGLPTGWVYAVIGVLAAAENVFPPVPADTAVGIGAALSAAGSVSALAVFGVTWTANVASAALVYGAARTLGRTFFRGRVGRRLLKPAALVRIERLYGAHGAWAIFFSRFVPAVRAVVPPFAGLAGVGPVRALLPMAVASALWYGLLTLLAATVIRNVDQVVRLVGNFNRVGVVVGAALVVLVVLVLVLRRRGHGAPDASQ